MAAIAGGFEKEKKKEEVRAGAGRRFNLFDLDLLSLPLFSFAPSSALSAWYLRRIGFRFFLRGCSTSGVEPFFYKISIAVVKGREKMKPLSPVLSAPSLPPSFSSLHLPPHQTSHRGSRLALASSHFVTALPKAVFFSGASRAST